LANLRGMQVEACMVDLDGTLVDTMGDFDAVVALMLKDLGLPALDRVHLEGMVGKGSEHLIQSVLQRQKPLKDPKTAPPSEAELTGLAHLPSPLPACEWPSQCRFSRSHGGASRFGGHGLANGMPNQQTPRFGPKAPATKRLE
jgi:hypothetical protein